MTNPKENGSASPQSQLVQNTLTSTIDFTGVPEGLHSPPDDLLRLACGDGKRMGQVTRWTTNWRDFSESLSVPEVGEKRGAFWCAADYGDSTRRNGNSVQAVSLIVLDVERKAEQPPPLADALALCEARGWQAFGHTTYTHTRDAPRYRLCIVPSRSIKPGELRRLVVAVAQELELECACDLAASGDSARLYYTPRVPSEAHKAMFEHGSVEGATVNVDEMLASAAPLMMEVFSDCAPPLAMENGQLLDDLQSALKYIESDSYESWIAGLMALKTAPISDARELAHWWSARSAKYSYEDCQNKWDSLVPTLTSFKAIFWKAQELGWVNPQRRTYGLADNSGLLGGVDSEAGKTTPIGPHPLARFVELDKEPKPPRWVLPGVIGQGLTVISGAQGVGKTTTILPLALMVAGLHGGELMPLHWRHVIYVTEDIEQAQRILAGMVRFGGLGIKQDDVKESLHLVAAVRLDAAKVAEVGDFYNEQFVRVVNGVEISPLVVFDTKSAIFAVDNENDNAEASRLVAAIKQNFANLPVWLVGHISKQNIGRTNVNEISTRGANAIEADANQTIFLVREGDARFIVLGKTRFEPRWRELEVHSYKASLMAKNEFGEDEELLLRWGIAAPASQSCKEATQQALEQQRKEDQAQLRHDIFHTVGAAWVMGNPLNREGVKAKVNRNRQTVTNMIENLLSERWLHEVTVPQKLRVKNSKKTYLVCLSTEEHDAILAGADLPAAYLVTPASWQKKVISSVPKLQGENGQVEESEMSFHPFPFHPFPFHPFPKKNTLGTGGMNSIFVHPPPFSTHSESDGNE